MRKRLNVSIFPRPLARTPLFAAALLLLVLRLTANAQFIYATNDGEISITGYAGLDGNVTIPNLIKGLPVTSVADFAFFRSGTLASVIIPDTATSIGSHSFSYCISLTNVTIGNSVRIIKNQAFSHCPNLTAVNCRGNLPSIGAPVFTRDTSATVYYLPGTTGWGQTLGGLPTVLWNPVVPFAYSLDDERVTIVKYTGSEGTVTIPSTIDFLPVTSIGEWAFSWSGLTGVVIANSVTSIARGAFAHCKALTDVRLGDELASIGSYVFADSGLTSITLSNTVVSIGDQAFGWCSLSSVTIPDSVTNIGGQAFYQTSVTNATIGNGITKIEDSTFEYCRSLTAVTLGNGVISIGDFAFSSCTSLGTLRIPDSVSSIGAYSFINCYALSNVTIGNAPTVGSNAFRGDGRAIVYYLPGSTGWGPTFGGLPTSTWQYLPE